MRIKLDNPWTCTTESSVNAEYCSSTQELLLLFGKSWILSDRAGVEGERGRGISMYWIPMMYHGMYVRVISPKPHDHPMLSCVTLAPFSSGRNADCRVDKPGLESRLWNSLALWVWARPFPSLRLRSHRLQQFPSDRLAVGLSELTLRKDI